MKKKVIIISIIFLLNLAFKCYKITSIPPGSTYDEIIYVSEAQVILKQGSDLSGKWRPWHFAPSDGMYSELTSTSLIPGFLMFPNNPILASKFMPVILGSFIPVLIALIVYFFYKDDIFLITAGVVATLNPWIFQFSRMGYDSLFSVSFYLIGLTLLLYLEDWKKLWSIPFFFWGFFQYQGHKLVLVPLITLTVLFLIVKSLPNFSRQKLNTAIKENLPILCVMLFAFLLTISYLVRLSTISSSVRSEEFTIVDQGELSREIDEKRRMSLNSPFTSIIHNKATATGGVLFNRLIKSFDPYILFIRGDKSVDTFTVFDYGFFHKVDILLILALFLLSSLASKKQILAVGYFVLFSLMGSIPNLLRKGQVWITFRGAFSFIGLVMIISSGLGLLLSKIPKKWRLLAVCFYIFCTSGFLYTYFNRYPITQTLYPGFYERVLANYLVRQPEKNYLLIVERTDASYDYLLTYNKLLKYEDKISLERAASSRQREFSSGKIKIFENCPNNWEGLINQDTIIAIDLLNQPCNPPNVNNETIEIKSLIDSGTRFTIFNDTLCAQYPLDPYPHLKDNRFVVEKLTDQVFCKSFFYR